VDVLWAGRLQCSPEDLHVPGLHLIRGERLAEPVFMKYASPFFALFPLHTPNSVAIVSTQSVCDEIAGWYLNDEHLSPKDLEPRLLEVALRVNHGEAYVFDTLTAAPDELHLDLSDEVVQLDPNSAEATEWSGVRLSAEVDGAIFGIFDEGGLAAWAGQKRMSDVAHDIQVATRSDVRGRGLARKVASRAIETIVQSGLIPFYSHFRDNTPSARLAVALGFRPYGSAVLAEYQVGGAE
jgi:GNAT superfamily N-acetyltransferase